jgi:hypothetical protein
VVSWATWHIFDGRNWYADAKQMVDVMERPDPLAPPEGYGAPSPQDDRPYRCAQVLGSAGEHCSAPITEIWEIGCLAHEHAGKIAYCEAHAELASVTRLRCGQCQDDLGENNTMQTFRRLDLDGNELGPARSQRLAEQTIREIFG